MLACSGGGPPPYVSPPETGALLPTKPSPGAPPMVPQCPPVDAEPPLVTDAAGPGGPGIGVLSVPLGVL